jgi:hypothetical protein
MTLGGLWHGANWTFVLWGFFHGVLLCLDRILGLRRLANIKGFSFQKVLGVIVTFHLICIGFILFRSSSFTAALAMATCIVTNFTVTPIALTMLGLVAFHAAPLFLLEWITEGEDRLDRLFRASWPRQALAYGYLVFMLVVFPAVQAHEFIYFQF